MKEYPLETAALVLAVTAAWITALAANGQTFAVVKSFDATNGANPYGAVILSGNTLYGTTSSGGSSNYGTVFRVRTDGSGYTVLKHFTGPDGRDPRAELVLGGSTLYGTTYFGGTSNYGTVFKINTNGTGFEVLKHFAGADGAYPRAGLILSGTTLFGTTVNGGALSTGTVFKVSTNGTQFSVLKEFMGTDGAEPYAGLLLNGDALYGTTTRGGTSNSGTVFRLTTNGSSYVILKHFTFSEGFRPQGELALGGNTLYGTTSFGGLGPGTLFKVNTDGSAFQVLRRLGERLGDGSISHGRLVLSGSALYGTISGGATPRGAVFQTDTAGSTWLIVKSFADGEGASPFGGLSMFGTRLYGTTGSGGAFHEGTIFSLGLAFSISAQPQSQTVPCNGTATFNVTASGDGPLSYQWLFNGIPIDGATGSSLTIDPVDCGHAGEYAVRITDAAGSATSMPAVLTVTAADTPALFCPNDITVFSQFESVPQPDPDSTDAVGFCGGVSKHWLRDEVQTEGCFQFISRHYEATNNCGQSATCTQRITVRNAPTILGLTISRTNVPQGLHVLICANVAGPVERYEWTVDPATPVYMNAFGNCLELIFDPVEETQYSFNLLVFNNCHFIGTGDQPIVNCAICVTRGSPSLLVGTDGSGSGPVSSSGGCGNLTSNARWFKLIASDTGPLTISTEGSSYDTMLAVFRGPLTQLVPVACHDNLTASIRQSRLTLNVTNGVVHWIAVEPRTAAATLRLAAGFAPRIEMYRLNPDRSFELRSSKAPAITYKLEASSEASTNASNWTSVLVTNLNPASPYVDYRETNSRAYPRRFYRILPGP